MPEALWYFLFSLYRGGPILKLAHQNQDLSEIIEEPTPFQNDNEIGGATTISKIEGINSKLNHTVSVINADTTMFQLLKQFPNQNKKNLRALNNISGVPNKTQDNQEDGTNTSIFEYMIPPHNNFLFQASNQEGSMMSRDKSEDNQSV